MNIPKQVALYLQKMGHGVYSETTDAGNIFVDYLPSKSNSIAIMTRPGTPPDLWNNYRVSGIQIFYRGTVNPVASADKATEIYEELIGFKGEFIEGENWIVNCGSYQSSPECLGRGENMWFEYSINFLINHKSKEE